MVGFRTKIREYYLGRFFWFFGCYKRKIHEEESKQESERQDESCDPTTPFGVKLDRLGGGWGDNRGSSAPPSMRRRHAETHPHFLSICALQHLLPTLLSIQTTPRTLPYPPGLSPRPLHSRTNRKLTCANIFSYFQLVISRPGKRPVSEGVRPVGIFNIGISSPIGTRATSGEHNKWDGCPAARDETTMRHQTPMRRTADQTPPKSLLVVFTQKM